MAGRECPNCGTDIYMVDGGIAVGITPPATRYVIHDTVCVRCGLVYREGVTPNQDSTPSTVYRGRLNFNDRKTKSKEKIASKKLYDRTLYSGWIQVIETLQQSIREQSESECSGHAKHFLYCFMILTQHLHRALDTRIETIDKWFKANE